MVDIPINSEIRQDNEPLSRISGRDREQLLTSLRNEGLTVEIDENDQAYVVYSIEEAHRVQEVMFDKVPPIHQLEFSKWLSILHPEALEGRVTSADYIMLPIFDGPKYTQLTQELPIETQMLYVNFSKRHNTRLNTEEFYRRLRPIKVGNGGDERTSMFEISLTNPLEVTAYALDAEIDFLEELIDPRNEKVLSRLQQMGVPAPYVCVGVTNGGVSFTYGDLAPDPETGEVETKLILFGKRMEDLNENETTLAAQDMSKDRFARVSRSVTDTGHNWRGRNRHIPDMMFPKIEGQSERYFQIMKEAGLVVQEPTDDLPFYTIDFPHGDDPVAILSKLKSASEKIKEESEKLKHDSRFEDPIQISIRQNLEDMPAIRRLNIDRFFAVAEQTTWECWRGKAERPYPDHAEKGQLNKTGEVAFYNIKGYRDLREALERAHIEKDRTTEMLVSAAHYTLYEMSRIVGETKWRFENQQADKFDNFNILVNHNIIASDPTRIAGIKEHPEIFGVLVQSALWIRTPEFKRGMAEHLAKMFQEGSGLSERQFATLMEDAVMNLDFTPTVGFTSCDLDTPNTGWFIYVDPEQSEHEWGSIVGGPPSSVDARLGGNIANLSIEKNMRDLLAKKDSHPEEWTEDDETSLRSYRSVIGALREIRNKKTPTISMPDEVRQKLNISDEDPNLIIIRGAKLKGLPPFDIAVYKLST